MERIIEDYEWTPPKNQTKEHYLLENLAMVYLRERGLEYIGTEVFIPGMNNKDSKRHIIDCVGVDKKQEKSYGIEVKVSKSDFKNGYCSRCNYTYIMCPKDMLDKDELPSHIGLIYVDVDNCKFITNAKERRLQGVTLIKKAKYNVNDVYYNADGTVCEDMMFAYTQRMVNNIIRSNLNELLYNTNRVPKAKIVKGRRRYK